MSACIKNQRKKNIKVYLSVDGWTEYWYFDWLQNQINEREESLFTIKFEIEIGINPESFVKKTGVLGKELFVHVFDFESQEKVHVDRVRGIIDSLKKAKSLKSVQYEMAYSNFTFELWMLLHKKQFNRSLTHRDQYLSPINKAYNQKFKSLKEYKEKANFQRILDRISLSDVIDAVKRGEKITQNNYREYQLQTYKKYVFFRENPSLSVHEFVEKILKKCGLM